MKFFFYGEKTDYPLVKWIAMFWVELIYCWGAMGVYLAYTYYRDRERLFRIEQEKKELELRQLNEQLNPHFLFNALNNIYSHLLPQPGPGKELILKLSELMRYVLDSNKKVKVPLGEEIAFIEHYIAFEQERLGKRCRVIYEKEAIADDACIIPLILFTFIENAFKHGTTVIKPSEIAIRIQTDGTQLHLFVRNEIHRKSQQSTLTGLHNAGRRLELLYPEAYRLDISETKEHYTVNLELNNLSCPSDVS
jgi:LytS/YehU family sensor histidine kinase